MENPISRNPWILGEDVSHIFNRYSRQHYYFRSAERFSYELYFRIFEDPAVDTITRVDSQSTTHRIFYKSTEHSATDIQLYVRSVRFIHRTLSFPQRATHQPKQVLPLRLSSAQSVYSIPAPTGELLIPRNIGVKILSFYTSSETSVLFNLVSFYAFFKWWLLPSLHTRYLFGTQLHSHTQKLFWNLN